MTVSKREMTLGVIALAALLGGATWYLIDGKHDQWKGMAGEIERTQRQIHLYRRAIERQEDWTQELDRLQSQLPKYKNDRRSVGPDLMKTIKACARRHGLSVLKNTPYPEKKIGNLYETGINLSWEASLEGIVAFLADLQNQGVRYDVRQLNVQPVGKNSGKLKGNMVIYCAYVRN